MTIINYVGKIPTNERYTHSATLLFSYPDGHFETVVASQFSDNTDMD